MRLLRYAALEGELSAGLGISTEVQGEGSDGSFEAVVAELLHMTDDEGEGVRKPDTRREAARTKSARDGSKSVAKLETRMTRRAERMALDAVRHRELLDNRELRQARSLTRRWFVLGRALHAAMQADALQAAALRAAIEPFVFREDERALLGWEPKPAISES